MMRARLFLHVASLEARKAMTYRVDFWIQAILGFAVGIVMPWFLWTAIFAESGQEEIAGFRFEGMVLYYVAIALLNKLIRGPDLLSAVSQDIYEGALSRYLVYPAGYLPFKYAQHVGWIAPFSVQLVLFGGVVLFFVPDPATAGLSWTGIVMAAPAIAVANLLFFLMSYPLQAVAFWADNVWSLGVLLRFAAGLLGGGMLPLALYPEWAHDALLWSPFPAVFHLPVSALLGRLSLAEWALGLAVGLGWCFVIFAIGQLVWRRGELRYTGVGI